VQERFREQLSSLGRVFERLLVLQGERKIYLVGGAVRDLLLNKSPQDYDFAVSGSGIEFARGFAREVRGKLVVLSEDDDEARVVYRKRLILDFNGLRGGAIEQDLGQRDFTINAMAVEVGNFDLIDPFGGQRDLKNRLIKPVADNSLDLDPLRLLRSFRFGLEMGFLVDDAVRLQGRRVSLQNTAPERIGYELLRILEAVNGVLVLVELRELGKLLEILPEIAPLSADEELWQHTLRTCYKLEEILLHPGFFERFKPEWDAYFNRMPYRRALLKLAALLHDVAKPHTRFVNEAGETHFYGHDGLGARLVVKIGYERLRLSRNQVRVVQTLVKEHMRLHLLATAPELSERAIRRFFRDLGDEAFGLMILCYADGWATAGRTVHLEATITRMLEQRRAELAEQRVKRLVTGDDLIALGLKPGPVFRVILQELEDLQIEGKITTKEEGIEYLKSYLSNLDK